MSEVLTRSDHWEQRYRDWWDRPFHGMTQEPAKVMAAEENRIAAATVRILRTDHVVLDACCGYGRLMPMIAPLVKHYHGVDFAQPAIWHALEHRAENAMFFLRDIMDFHGGPYDAIFMVGARSSLEDRWDDAIDHLRTLLKPDGRLLVFEGNYQAVIGR